MNEVPTQRKVSGILGIGIFFMPYIFSWFTLKEGYSKNTKIISFIWMFFVIVMLASGNSKTNTEPVKEQMNIDQSNSNQRTKQQEANAQKLYTYYKNMRGNEDTRGFNEQEYVGGQLLTVCKISGKPRGYYGWIEFRTIFIEGQRFKDSPIERMYVFFITDGNPGDDISGMWRGEQHKKAILDDMRKTCD